MASYDMHWEQAEHNQELVNELAGLSGPIRYRDWAVTAAFYAAIHYVEAFLDWGYQCHTDQEANRHRFRLMKVEKLLTEVPVGVEYRNLLNTSISLRYLFNRGNTTASTSGNWLSDVDVRRMTVTDLGRIKNSVMRQWEAIS